jgi:hypothetical protein
MVNAFLLPFALGDVAVASVITHHLFSSVRDVRTHGGKPFQRREDLGCLAVLGCINDRPLLIQVLHPLLGEGRPDEVAGQVRIIVGEMRLPQKTLKPECHHVESMATTSLVVSLLSRSILNTLCRKMASSFFNSRGGVTLNMPPSP